MDASLFEVLGKYAGLAGLSVGLLLVLINGLLKLNIFTKITPEKTYSFLRQLMYLTFAIGIVGIIAWLAINVKKQASTSITGRVADSSTKQAIDDAEITLSGRSETARTDGAGNFDLSFHPPIPAETLHLFISKVGFEPFNRLVGVGEHLEAEIVPAKTSVNPPAPAPEKKLVPTSEVYTSDDVASGSCADMGAWSTVCTPDKPPGWTIINAQFNLTGDRAGCAYANCEPLGTATASKACYRFRTQGHSEECGHSGNTGIHYSKGVLNVVWSHPE